MSLLGSVPLLAGDLKTLRQKLFDIAGLSLCRRYHQKAEGVVESWCAMIVAELKRKYRSEPCHDASTQPDGDLQHKKARPPVQQEAARSGRRESYPPSFSDSCRRPIGAEKINLACQKADENESRHQVEDRCRQEAERHAQDQREQQKTARRQREAEEAARREREEQEAESCRKAEREQYEVREERRKQEIREHAEEEQRAWASSWEKYDGNWEQITRLKAMVNAQTRPRLLYSFISPITQTHSFLPGLQSVDWQQVVRAIWPEYHPRYIPDSKGLDAFHVGLKDILPWPVRAGTWQEVNERSVEDFFRRALKQQDPCEFKRLLRAQALRWHPDRMLQLLGPRASGDVMSHATLVAQVINTMMERVREAAVSKS